MDCELLVLGLLVIVILAGVAWLFGGKLRF
jgi:hypothetical protein